MAPTGKRGMTNCRKVAIVGGGISALCAIKSMKEESMEPVCFEKCSEIGGIWCYRDKDDEYDPATVMSTTTLLHSKESGALSDFPFPEHLPNYMRHDEVHQFFLHACEALDLRRHIICNREVVAVKRAADYDITGRWDVTVRDTKSQKTVTETFDAVIMCTGLNGPPNMPSYPGLEQFRGKVMHSQKLRTFESFAGKKVVVVGTGCSAVDAAVEISNVAKKVYWSVRTPSWIVSRIGPHGIPMDYVVIRRYILLLFDTLPLSWTSKLFQHLYINPRFNHKFYGIDPTYPMLSRDPVVNDHIPTKLLNGSVVLRKNIAKVETDGVVFENEASVTNVDTIVMATGYKFSVPCLEEGILIQEKKGKIHLYKCVFPPHLKHPTLSFVGCFLPYGAGFPIGELQSRWIAHVLSGKGSLPSEEEMKKEVEERYQSNAKRFSPSDKMSQRVDYVPYLDDLSSEIGAKPNFWKMAFTDPVLFAACIVGPSLPYQYRLVGPHKWAGARRAILDASRRVKAPLKPEENLVSYWDFREDHLLWKVVLIVLAALMLLLPLDNPITSGIFPLLFVLHLMLIRGVGGNILFHSFLLISLASWFLFPSSISFVILLQIVVVLACN